MNFGENLKRIRKSKGFTQEQLALMCGISRNALAKIETRWNEPTVKNLRKIAKALDCTAGELLGEEPKLIYKDYPSVGRWEVFQLKELGEAWTVQCSVCKAIGFHGKTPFCPECGARME